MVQWHYQRPAGKQVGPVSADELRKLADVGTITPETLVRRDNDTQWIPARRVKGLLDERTIANAEPAFASPGKGLFSRLVSKMRRGPSRPGMGPPRPPSLPRRRKRMLLPVLLSVLIAIAALSVVLQVCILATLSGIASKPVLSVGSAQSTDWHKHLRASIPVTITDFDLNVNVQNTPDVNVQNTPDVNVQNTLDVNVQNTDLDVNVQNRPDVNVWNTPDVNLQYHNIKDGDPIPVKIEP